MEQKFEKIPLRQKLHDYLVENANKSNDELADDFTQFIKIGKIESKISVLNDVIKDLEDQLHNKSRLDNQAKSIQIALTREISRCHRLRKELTNIKKGLPAREYNQGYSNVATPVQTEEVNGNKI